MCVCVCVCVILSGSEPNNVTGVRTSYFDVTIMLVSHNNTQTIPILFLKMSYYLLICGIFTEYYF